MQKQNDLLMDVSILYRTTQKFYDRMLQSHDLTYAQLPILLLIYENEGISMQTIAIKGQYDKGTITKNVQKLVNLGYVQIVPSKKDKRLKELYTTDKTKQIVSSIYRIRRDWWNHLIKNIPFEKLDDFTNIYQQISENASQYANVEPERIQFFKIKKLSMDDYPDALCTTLSTGGCNFRCPGCLKSDLVFLKEDVIPISNDSIKAHFEQRKDVIKAVCIQGGEPLMHEHLDDILMYLKDNNYLIKIDTNGTFPKRLKNWVDRGLIDYVSVNIKNTKRNYKKSIGVEKAELSKIQETIDFLMSDVVEYHFVLDVIAELHTKDTIQTIGKWLHGAKKMILNTYKPNESAIQSDLHGYSRDIMEEFAKCIEDDFDYVIVK